MHIIPGRLETLFFKTLTRISPTLNTKAYYRRKFGRQLELKDPKTFNEKILKLKLENYNSNSLVKQCADKYLVRDYIEKLGCGELLITAFGSTTTPFSTDAVGLT